MKREELFTLELNKKEDLESSLKPIQDWVNIKNGTMIYHCDSNNILNYNFFIELKDNLVIYKNKKNKQCTRSKTGWYYYDESIVDDIEEKWTPKLWIITSIKYPEDYTFIVACNEKHLLKCFNEEMKTHLSFEEFQEEYYVSIFNKCDDFTVKLI